MENNKFFELEREYGNVAAGTDSYSVYRQHFSEAISVMTKFIESDDCMRSVKEAVDAMVSTITRGGKIIAIGNGGSCSDAAHFVSELTGKYRGVRQPIAAIALSDAGAMSCIANDFGYSNVFVRQVQAIGKFEDTLLCLSTSGKSENVVKAAEHAKRYGLFVVSITGSNGDQLARYSDVVIRIPHCGTADRIQEVGLVLIHAIVDQLERRV